MLKIENLSKSINNKIILNNVTLEAHAGSLVFLVGESGAGKSTLLRILNDLESYTHGSITIDGKKLESGNVHKVVSLVFQHFNLFPHLTVSENITLALEKVHGKTAAQAQVIADELIKKYKLDSTVLLPVGRLSGGQKQRLAIARALAANPPIICLDEPTSALDPMLTNQVACHIAELAREGRIVLVATHDMNLVLNPVLSGTIYLMAQGTIIEKASPYEIKNNPEKLEYITRFMQGEEC